MNFHPHLHALVLLWLLTIAASAQQPTRIYLAPDDHTDYLWAANEADSKANFVRMLDYYVNQAELTAGDPPAYQSRFATDGSFWLWTYEHAYATNAGMFDNLMEQVAAGRIAVPLTPLVVTWGGVPVEAAIRSMLYPGSLERRYGVRFVTAQAMENQTLPYGLGSVWAGAGARYAWHGVCDCSTSITGLNNRPREIYWWTGPDGSRLLLKWYSILNGNESVGGYAEARSPGSVVDYVSGNAAFTNRYKFKVIGVFGQGWDDAITTNLAIRTAAIAKTTTNRQVVVSNMDDFFRDFETNYSAQLTNFNASFGNEWDGNPASLAEVSSRVKRSLYTLRAAEAMGALVSLRQPGFYRATNQLATRDLAMLNFGMFFEHDFITDSGCCGTERVAWQRRTAGGIESYVTNYFRAAQTNLAALIPRDGTNRQFFAFNPLGWTRSDIADFPFTNAAPVRVLDQTTGAEVPSQIVTNDGVRALRVLAADVPSLGYKVFEVRDGAGTNFPPALNAVLGAGSASLTNEFFQLTVTNRGAIVSLRDLARGGREFVKSVGSRFANDLGNGGGTLDIESAGPVSVTVRAVDAANNAPLRHTTRITLHRGLRRIDLRNDITQNWGNAARTYGFGFALTNVTARHEEIGAVLTARLTSAGGHYATSQARYDWLTLNSFADLTAGDQAGMTLANSDCYFFQLGNSTLTTLDTNTPALNALVGGKLGAGYGVANQGGDAAFLQRFALQTHGAFDAANAMRFAQEHQHPLVTGTVTGTTPSLPARHYSFLSVNNSDVLLWALKPSEEGVTNGLIARVWHLGTNATNFALSLALPVSSATRTTHIETDLAPETVTNSVLLASINQQQIATFRLRPDFRATITGIAEAAGSTVVLTAVGQPGFAYQVEGSTNLTAWTGLTNLTASSVGALQFNESKTNAPYRFYRFRLR